MIRSLRHLLPLLLMALAVPAGGPSLAAPTPQPAGVTMDARPAYEGAFRVGTWLPVVVDLANSGVDRVVQVQVGARQGPEYATRVELPSGGRKSLIVYAYMTQASRRLDVQLLDGNQQLAGETLQLIPANRRTLIIGVLGGQGAVVRPPARLPSGEAILAVTLAPTDVPDHPLGLGGLNALVVEEVDTAELSMSQRAALVEWVARGGQLILGGGAGLAEVLAGLPETLRPASFGGGKTAPAGSVFRELDSGASMPLVRLDPLPDREGRMPYQVPITPFAGAVGALEQRLGRGTVVALAFPLGHPTLAAWDDAPRLWEELLRPAFELPPGFAPESMTLDGYVEGSLAATLTSLPALEFPPLGLLATLVAIYIVLVGPITYLVLRRLDRQALGWVVVPAITLLFATLTYGLGYTQRGGDIFFNQVSLLEPVEGRPGEARVRAFVGLFSPERRTYTLRLDAGDEVAPYPLLRPISLQGPWDPAGPAGRGIYLQEQAASAEARAFEVAQWAMRAVAVDSTTSLEGLTATLRVDGNTLTATVVNDSALALSDVALVQGEQIARIASLQPGETWTGELGRRRQAQPGAFGSAPPVSYLVYGEEMERQGRPGGEPPSPATQQRIRILDALFSYGPLPRGGQPMLLAWADLSTFAVQLPEQRADRQQIALVAATPRLELPAGEVSLGRGWLAPRFESGMTSVCFGGQGTGVTLGAQPATMQLQLPRDLYGLRPSELSLLTASDGPWFDETQIELYDWTVGIWTPQVIADRKVVVDEPAHFLGSHGILRLRISSGQPLGNFGCIYVDARLKGIL